MEGVIESTPLRIISDNNIFEFHIWDTKTMSASISVQNTINLKVFKGSPNYCYIHSH